MKEEKLLKLIIDNKMGKELAQLLYDTKKEIFDDIEKELLTETHYSKVILKELKDKYEVN